MVAQIGKEYNIKSYHDDLGRHIFRGIVLEETGACQYIIRVTAYTNPRITGTKVGDEFAVSRNRIISLVTPIVTNNKEALSLLRRD